MGGLVSALNKKYREQIRTGHFPICYLCGLPIKKQNQVSQDHIIPKALGGDTVQINLVCTHKKCNNDKGAMTVQEWFDRQRE